MLQSQNRPEHHALKVCLGWDHMSASLLRRKLMLCSGSKFFSCKVLGSAPAVCITCPVVGHLPTTSGPTLIIPSCSALAVCQLISMYNASSTTA